MPDTATPLISSHPAPPGYWTSPAAIQEQICGLESDIEGWQNTVAQNLEEIPRMERQTLELQRDIAVTQLKVIDLRARLVQKLGVQ